jgi:hypothetical protein
MPTQVYDPSKIVAANQRWFDQLSSGMEKAAEASVDDYTKYRIREEGVGRKSVIPFKPADNSMLTPQMNEDLVIIEFMEMDSPGAVGGDLNALPEGIEIFAGRYKVKFSTWMGAKFYKNVDKLRTYTKIDVRQVVADQQVRDLSDAEDAMLFRTARTCAGTLDTVNSFSGVIQWATIYDGVTRESVQDALKLLPRTPSRLQTKTAVMNVNTGREWLKWHRDEVGGDMAQDWLQTGKFATEHGGVTWVGTIKDDIVPDGRLHHFGPDDYMGKAYDLEAPTMYMKKEYYNVEFQLRSISGLTIANTNSCGITQFAGI